MCLSRRRMTKEENFLIATVSSDIHVMRNGGPSNLKTPFSAKVIGIENPRAKGTRVRLRRRSCGRSRDAAAWVGVKFHSVTDMVQMADEAAKRDGLSSAEALAKIPATFVADVRVERLEVGSLIPVARAGPCEAP